jgi:hypothetical protein
MTRHDWRFVAMGLLLPLIALATTLTSALAATSSPSLRSHADFKFGRGQAHGQARHIASLKSLDGQRPALEAGGPHNLPGSAVTAPGAPSGTSGHAKTRLVPSAQTPVAAPTPAAVDAPTQAPFVPAPILGATFNSFTEPADGTATPPDSAIAAGPFQLVAIANSEIKVFNRNGSPVLTSGVGVLTPGFTDGIFDPRVFFDQTLGRFWIFTVSEHDAVSSDPVNRSTLIVAVSDGNDATQGWHVFLMDATIDAGTPTNNWCDYPMLGVDATDIILSCNMYNFPSPGQFQYAKVRVMSKSQFTSVPSTCCFWDEATKLPGENSAQPFASTVQPAREYGASSADGEWLVDAHRSCNPCHTLEVWQITGGVGNRSLNHQSIDVGNFPEPPPQARQAGGHNNIDTGLGRLLFSFWKSGHLSTGQTMACDTSISGVSPGACAAYTELDVSGGLNNMSKVNDFFIGGDGNDRFYPVVDVNAAGDKTMVYSVSGPTTFIAANYIGIPHDLISCTGGQCLNTPEVTLASGNGDYQQFDCTFNPTSCPLPRNRWGDYFAAAADPDGTGVWVQGEFAGPASSVQLCGLGLACWGMVVGLTYESPDTTPPVTTASIAPPPNAAGWNHGGIFVTLNATDAESAVQNIQYNIIGSQAAATTTVAGNFALIGLQNIDGQSSIQYRATDAWGNVEATKVLPVNIDSSAPNGFCLPQNPTSVWYATDQLASCAFSDEPSGLADPSDASFTLSTSVPDGTETSSALTGSRVVCDVAGNCITAGPIGPFMIDKKAPDIMINSPTTLTTYTLNQVATASYSCTDGGSGVASCTGPVPSGAHLDTTTVGVHQFTVNAVDNVGNKSSQTVTYFVSYAVCLQYDPKIAHPAGAYPFQIELCDAVGKDVSSAKVTVTADKILPIAIPPVSSAQPNNVFVFDPTIGSSGGYVYVLRTSALNPGNYDLEVSATGDPNDHVLPFTLK